MASNQTQHYQLSQWEASDKVERLDFNADNAKIDGALHTMAEQVANKAENSAVSALTSRVNAKAEQSALTAEQTARQSADNAEKAAREEADAALRNENCWVKLGEKILSSAASTITLTLSNAALYQKILIEFAISGNTDLEFSLNDGIAFHRGGYSGRVSSLAVISSGAPSVMAGGYLYLMRGMSNTGLMGFYDTMTTDGSSTRTSRGSIISSNDAFSELTRVNLSTADSMAANSRFVLYGMKK